MSRDVRASKGQSLLEERIAMEPEAIINAEKALWTRSAPADPYYQRDPANPLMMRATQKLNDLCQTFEDTCMKPAREARAEHNYQPPVQPKK